MLLYYSVRIGMATRQRSYTVEQKLSFVRRLKEEFGSNISFVSCELGILTRREWRAKLASKETPDKKCRRAVGWVWLYS